MFASARERSPDATALICAKHRARELDGREGRDEEDDPTKRPGLNQMDNVQGECSSPTVDASRKVTTRPKARICEHACLPSLDRLA